MSNKTFENLLREVLVDLKDLIEYEKPPVDVPKNKQDQLHFFKQHYLSMYIRYLLVFCKLEVTHPSLYSNSIKRIAMIKFYSHKREKT